MSSGGNDDRGPVFQAEIEASRENLQRTGAVVLATVEKERAMHALVLDETSGEVEIREIGRANHICPKCQGACSVGGLACQRCKSLGMISDPPPANPQPQRLPPARVMIEDEKAQRIHGAQQTASVSPFPDKERQELINQRLRAELVLTEISEHVRPKIHEQIQENLEQGVVLEQRLQEAMLNQERLLSEIAWVEHRLGSIPDADPDEPRVVRRKCTVCGKPTGTCEHKPPTQEEWDAATKAEKNVCDNDCVDG